MGTIFRIRETEPYNHLMKFYKIGPLLEVCFMVLSPIFKIGQCLEPLLKMLLGPSWTVRTFSWYRHRPKVSTVVRIFEAVRRARGRYRVCG
jgi:hypothetical protein